MEEIMRKFGILVLLGIVLFTVACGDVKPTRDATADEIAEMEEVFALSIEGITLFTESNLDGSSVEFVEDGIEVTVSMDDTSFTYEISALVDGISIDANYKFDGLSFKDFMNGADIPSLKITGDATVTYEGKTGKVNLNDGLTFRLKDGDDLPTVTGEIWYTTLAGDTVRISGSKLTELLGS